MPFLALFVVGNVVQFTLPASFFKEGLGRHGFWLAGKGLLVEEADGQAVAGVLGSFSCIVGLDAFLDIGGVARIERSIRTLQDIHIGLTFHSRSPESHPYNPRYLDGQRGEAKF